MRDLILQLPNRPRELERVTDILSRVGVNLKSVAALTLGGEGIIRLIPDDIDVARRALSENNIAFEEEEIVSVLLENQAGELALVAHKLAEAGLNLHAIYVTGAEADLLELAIAVDDVAKAKKILE